MIRALATFYVWPLEFNYGIRGQLSAATSIVLPLIFVFLVPPEKPRIYTVEDNSEVRLKLGPYKIGDTVRLRCVSLGGRPIPRVTWWRDHALLDATDRNYAGK